MHPLLLAVAAFMESEHLPAAASPVDDELWLLGRIRSRKTSSCFVAAETKRGENQLLVHMAVNFKNLLCAPRQHVAQGYLNENSTSTTIWRYFTYPFTAV